MCSVGSRLIVVRINVNGGQPGWGLVLSCIALPCGSVAIFQELVNRLGVALS